MRHQNRAAPGAALVRVLPHAPQRHSGGDAERTAQLVLSGGQIHHTAVGAQGIQTILDRGGRIHLAGRVGTPFGGVQVVHHRVAGSAVRRSHNRGLAGLASRHIHQLHIGQSHAHRLVSHCRAGQLHHQAVNRRGIQRFGTAHLHQIAPRKRQQVVAFFQLESTHTPCGGGVAGGAVHAA